MLNRTCTAVAVASVAAQSGLAQVGWTEDFDDGVGRFTFVSGDGESDFVHESATASLSAFFERRSIVDTIPSRRLALLPRPYTELESATISVEWTPISSAGGFSWPLIGFFDSSSLRDIGVIRVRDNLTNPLRGTWETSINWNAPNTFNFNAGDGDGFVPWVGGETYLLELRLDGPAAEMTFSVSRLVDGDSVGEGARTWSVPGGTWSFDAVGIGNLVDEAVGGTHTATFDNFAFIPGCPADLNGDGIVDLSDVTTFVGSFVLQQPAADLAEPFGVFDLADIGAFIDGVNAGCP